MLCDQVEEEGESITQIRMRKAFAQLSERDKLVLTYLVIAKMPAIEAYPMVERMIHPIAKDGMTKRPSQIKLDSQATPRCNVFDERICIEASTY